ncbi:hypothetical protein [Streptomyces sp. E2N166]|uniref:hypothetical protein n=1 Tax=Streptomyces sp. E2N166 TaxID=1851909 RepID=UPI00187D2C65|nr:hypothetical protein [Streptomyces sp. E2N166]
MKDIVVGILVGLVVLATFVAVLWVMSRSTEANEEECRSEAEEYGNQATCIVVIR